MKVTPLSKLVLVEMLIRPDRDAYIVEDVVNGEFYEMSEASIAALQEIRSGKPLEEIQPQLEKQFPDEDIDMVLFAEQLIELGLVKELDGASLVHDGTDRSPRKKEHFQWIAPAFAKLFFNPVTLMLYGILCVVNVGLVILYPHLFPLYKDIFVFDSMVMNSLLWLVVTLVFVMIHEMGHILAVRSYGLSTRLGIGQRFIFIVFETEMDHIWRLSPKERNVAYLAGMCFDQTMLFLCLALQLLVPDNVYVSSLAAVAAFNILIKVVYQCCFFMKTDLYYVLENSSGCYNLMERSRAWMAGKLPGLRRSETSAGPEEAEVRAVRLYSGIYLAGYLLNIGIAVFYIAPFLYSSIKAVLPKFATPVSGAAFWDAVIYFCELGLMVSLLLYTWRKRKRESGMSASKI